MYCLGEISSSPLYQPLFLRPSTGVGGTFNSSQRGRHNLRGLSVPNTYRTSDGIDNVNLIINFVSPMSYLLTYTGWGRETGVFISYFDVFNIIWDTLTQRTFLTTPYPITWTQSRHPWILRMYLCHLCLFWYFLFRPLHTIDTTPRSSEMNPRMPILLSKRCRVSHPFGRSLRTFWSLSVHEVRCWWKNRKFVVGCTNGTYE